MAYNLVTKFPIQIPCGSWSTGSSWVWTNVNSVQTGSKIGTKVENYRELIAKGQPAGSAYSLDAYRYFLGSPLAESLTMYRSGSNPSVVFLTSSFSGFPGAAWTDGSVAHLSVDKAKARSMALSKLYKKLESERSQLNSYAVVAEFTDVLRQFGRPFGAIVDAFTRHENRLIYERRRLVGSKTWRDEKFAKIAADTWLETSFGLIPLFSDATDIATAFGRFEYELSGESPKLRDRMRTRASESSIQIVQYPASASQPFSYIDYFVEKEHRTKVMVQYVVGLKGDVRAEFGSNQRLLELLGFEPRNIPMAVWEATPWSWLVDYWTNVQQILQAGATVTTRVQWIVLSETEKSIVTYRNKVRRLGTGSYPAIKLTSNRKFASSPVFGSANVESVLEDKGKYGPLSTGDIRLIRTTFARTLPGDLGVPPLYFKTPFEDLKKMANLGALVISKQRNHKTWLN